MPILAELEFRIGQRSDAKAGYPVSPRLLINGQEQIFSDDSLKIDLDELFNFRGEYAKYDARLSEVFFQAANVKEALYTACAHLDQAGSGNMLRVRLLIEAEAQELHHVRWECLRDTNGRPLFNGDTILFSRYLSSSNLHPIGAKTEPKTLIVIANPPHLDQAINPEDPQKGLAPVDVTNEKLRAETGLKSAGFAVTTLASPPYGTAAATLDNILNELEHGYDILYLVCHGGLVPQNGSPRPMLWLEDGEDPVDAAKLVEGIRNMAQQPRLVILASCQSAGADGTSASASGTLSALGPLLADAGVPAVIAMQGNIKMETVDKFMPQFFAELAKDGRIDRAMGKARGHVLDCDDYWMPTLFMRLTDGLIWSQPVSAPASPTPPDPDQDIKDQARKIFSDQSNGSVVFPIGQVIEADAQSGELKPNDPGVWKAIVPAPNMLPFAILRVFGAGRVLAVGHEHMLAYQELSDKSQLAKAGLVVISNAWGNFTPQEIDAITNFVNSGGGLLAAGLGWSWNRTLDKYPMNRLFKSFGASWTAN